MSAQGASVCSSSPHQPQLTYNLVGHSHHQKPEKSSSLHPVKAYHQKCWLCSGGFGPQGAGAVTTGRVGMGAERSNATGGQVPHASCRFQPSVSQPWTRKKPGISTAVKRLSRLRQCVFLKGRFEKVSLAKYRLFRGSPGRYSNRAGSQEPEELEWELR